MKDLLETTLSIVLALAILICAYSLLSTSLASLIDASMDRVVSVRDDIRR